jgi:hypothetical protein
MTCVLTGLDIEAKAAAAEAQLFGASRTEAVVCAPLDWP